MASPVGHASAEAAELTKVRALRQVPPSVRVRRALRRMSASIANVWLIAIVPLLWEAVARTSPTRYFPPLSEVMAEFKVMWLSSDWQRLFLSDLFYDTVVPSMSRLARGWGLAVVVGIVCGFIIGRSRLTARMFHPVIRFWMATPKVVLLPIAVQIFGIADSMNIFLIFFGTVWLILINTADGVAGVDAAWLRSARSMQLSRPTLYRRVLLPAASPQIFTGLRVSIGIGLILVIVSELYATTEGLGYQIAIFQSTFEYVRMWSAFLLIALIGILLNMAFTALERRAVRWQRRTGLGGL
ncbi:ABC transporter permease [Micromonospora sp. NPDC049051]|uniref:ABC transporter permease n=1 Tax=Micromonospora sp. NPDC049051 TaxID=3364264 RepID=UPI003712729A